MEFKVEIIEKLGVLGERKNNCTELRIVSWNNREPKYDIRGWYIGYDGEERSVKGFSFTEEEAKQILCIIETIDFSDKSLRKFGTIPQNDKCEILIQLTKYGYDIRSFSGNYGVKGYSLTETEVKNLIQILRERFGDEPINAPINEPDEEENEDEDEEKLEEESEEELDEESEDDKIVNSLTSIPVNDGNYPLQKATVNQLRKAISIMEKKPKGNKVRLDRCKAKLKSLERSRTYTADPPVKATATTASTATKATSTTTTTTSTSDEKKADVIQFPKKDTEPIKKLVPTGEHHGYSEAEAKLNKELQQFKGDRDSEYVIKGVLAACKKDQELLDNVMRPEKSYFGAMKYFFDKAKAGYCTRIGNVGIMSADTALRYAIDYFNSEEKKTATKKSDIKKSDDKKPDAKKSAAKVTNIAKGKATTRTATSKRSAWKKGVKRR